MFIPRSRDRFLSRDGYRDRILSRDESRDKNLSRDSSRDSFSLRDICIIDNMIVVKRLKLLFFNKQEKC
jgi:hypothetical protein